MLVKLHSTEMTAQRLSINPHTMTSILFWTAYLADFICFVADPVVQIDIVFVTVHWQQMELIGKKGNKRRRGGGVGGGTEVEECKVATLLLLFKRSTICNVGSPPDNVSGVTLAGNCTGVSVNSYHCVNIYLRM